MVAVVGRACTRVSLCLSLWFVLLLFVCCVRGGAACSLCACCSCGVRRGCACRCCGLSRWSRVRCFRRFIHFGLLCYSYLYKSGVEVCAHIFVCALRRACVRACVRVRVRVSLRVRAGARSSLSRSLCPSPRSAFLCVSQSFLVDFTLPLCLCVSPCVFPSNTFARGLAWHLVSFARGCALCVACTPRNAASAAALPNAQCSNALPNTAAKC